MFGFGQRKAEVETTAQPVDQQQDANVDTVVNEGPTGGTTNWKNLIPVIACGAGLFSDGYINNVCLISLSSLCLKRNYTRRKAQGICKIRKTRNGRLTRTMLHTGHRLRRHHSRPRISGSLEKLEREEVCGRHRVCWNGGGDVIVWISVSLSLSSPSRPPNDENESRKQ